MTTLPLPVRAPDTWTDIQGLTGLAAAARRDGKAALPAVARQFEAVFAQMLIKSMRAANFGGGILDSPQSEQWQGMFDNQLALSLANDGKGLGIATMLVRQLGGASQGTGADAATDPAASVPAAIPSGTGGNAATGSHAAAPGLLDRAARLVQSAGSTALRAARDLVFSGPDDFVQKLAPYARAVATRLGVSVRAVLAQAALETGWGQHMPRQADGSASNNLFGIKAGDGWQGKQVNVPTLEVEDGVPVRRNAAFRAYAGPARAFADYARMLGNNPRYAGALGHGEDVARFAQALHRAGYATDPAYAAKLTAIANSPTMRDALSSLKDSATLPTPES